MPTVQVQGVIPQLVFGTYTFPLTFQEQDRVSVLSLDKKKVPFNYGESVAGNSNMQARIITIGGPVGSMITGSGGNVLAGASDLELERRTLAGLQLLGRQPLYVGHDQYIMAYLEEFTHKFWQDAFGMRYADWVLKFYCDDPRYLSPTATTYTKASAAAGSATYVPVVTVGSVRTYPTCVFTGLTGSCVGPYIGVSGPGGVLSVAFSLLTMPAGATLSLNCDPRPASRSVAAVYNSGSGPVNGLQYCAIADFSNSYDLAQWFPFINPPTLESNISIFYGCLSGSGTYSFAMSWNDRWL